MVFSEEYNETVCSALYGDTVGCAQKVTQFKVQCIVLQCDVYSTMTQYAVHCIVMGCAVKSTMILIKVCKPVQQ